MSASSLDELSAEKKTLPLILLMNVSEIPTLSLSKGRDPYRDDEMPPMLSRLE